MKKREWRDVKGYEGLYQVSNDGYVRSLPDIDCLGRFKCGKIIKPGHREDGGRTVLLCRNSVEKNAKVHRLIAKAFLKNPKNKPQVNHKDGNRSNNHVTNLEWCTGSENAIHSYRVLKRMPALLGKKGILSKTSRRVSGISICGKKRLLFTSVTEASAYVKVSYSAVARCARGEGNSCRGYYWKYLSNEEYEKLNAKRK